MSLRFAGEFGLSAGLLLAAALALATLLWYWREVRRQPRATWILPPLRALAVFLLILTLTGPLLHRERRVPQPGTVLVLVDASRSMSVADPSQTALPESVRETPRSERVLAALRGDPDLLRQFEDNGTNHVRVIALTGSNSAELWNSANSERSKDLAIRADAPTTDLATGLLRAAESVGDSPNVRVVLFTDGQHNAKPSPLDAARQLAAKRIELHTVGLGPLTQPPGLAVLGVEAPESVYIEDRLKGTIRLRDDMPAGKPFTLTISRGDATLFRKELATDGSKRRTVEFDFPVREVANAEVARLKAEGVEAMSLPLEMSVHATPVEGEANTTDNAAEMAVRVVTHKRKVLLVDGRPRWEYRYLRNLFERDPQWEVNDLVAGIGGSGFWPRGTAPGTFPRDRETLYGYDLVILGEVPPQLVPEQAWLRDFVANRGGGLIVIDGTRNLLRGFAATPLGEAMPVRWRGFEPLGPARALRLTDAGAAATALRLAGDPTESAKIWATLKPPRSLVDVEPLADAQVMLEAAVENRAVPAAVFRRFGAGKVWYHAFDETWRWRFEVADLHHRRYWNQVAEAVMEPPYAVRDAHASLDVGGAIFEPGSRVPVTARLRDAMGTPILRGEAKAVIYKDGQVHETVPLRADANEGGRWTAETSALPSGHYELGVSVTGIPDSRMKARAAFVVRQTENEELKLLTRNEPLLKNMAELTGGRYFGEEDLAGLPDVIRASTPMKVEASDVRLGRSWWWFVPVVALLTVEWMLRKRFGLA